MTRTEPYSGLCNKCGQPVIVAHLTRTHAVVVVLDPHPDPSGPYRAHLGVHGLWIAAIVDPDGAAYPEGFKGSRRREHACPDQQLAIDV